MPRKTQKSEKESERYELTIGTIVENAHLEGGYRGEPFTADTNRSVVLKPVPAYSTKQLTQKDQLLLAAGSITFQEVKAASMIDRRGILQRTSKAMSGYNGIDIISEFSMNLGDVRSMTVLINRFKNERDSVYTFTLDDTGIQESFPDTQRGAMMLIDRPVLNVNEIADMCNGRRAEFSMRINGKSVMFDLHQFTDDGKISGDSNYPDITSSFGMVPSPEQNNDIDHGNVYNWKYCIYQHSKTTKIVDANVKYEYMFHKLMLRSVLSYFGIVPEAMIPSLDEQEQKYVAV